MGPRASPTVGSSAPRASRPTRLSRSATRRPRRSTPALAQRSKMPSPSCTGQPKPPSSSIVRGALRGSAASSHTTGPTLSSRLSAIRRRLLQASAHAEKSEGCGVRKEISITASSWLRSAPPPDDRDQLRRRFVEAARRAQIVTIVNRAQTEAELGELVTAELCEVFEAEIGFVLARSEDAAPHVVGAYGL